MACVRLASAASSSPRLPESCVGFVWPRENEAPESFAWWVPPNAPMRNATMPSKASCEQCTPAQLSVKPLSTAKSLNIDEIDRYHPDLNWPRYGCWVKPETF